MLRVADRLNRMPVLGEPRRRPSVQLSHVARRSAPEFQAQQITKKMVVPKPCALGVQRDHEGVGVFEISEDLLRPRSIDQQICQWPRDAVEERGAEQRRRTGSGWRSSTSAMRYSDTVRSLPENAARNASACGWPASA